MAYSEADYGGWPTYVPVAERRRKAAHEAATLRKQGVPISPVRINGPIATTFWGKAWCRNLEAYSDYASRLPRGRTYLRHGAVVDLQIAPGKLTARVMGSELYSVWIDIKPLPAAQWKALIKECAGQIDSLIELLQGKLSQGVLEILTRPHKGLFPEPRQIRLACSCPDSAKMCKHLAAVLYGVGACLDQQPELLFRLRNVDQLELITGAAAGTQLTKTATAEKSRELAGQDLSELFGIELDLGEVPNAKPSGRSVTRAAAPKKAAAPTWVTRKELLARGLTPSTLQTWLRRGFLVPTRTRGTYITTSAGREQLRG